jgi:hypothetical protein
MDTYYFTLARFVRRTTISPRFSRFVLPSELTQLRCFLRLLTVRHAGLARG